MRFLPTGVTIAYILNLIEKNSKYEKVVLYDCSRGAE